MERDLLRIITDRWGKPEDLPSETLSMGHSGYRKKHSGEFLAPLSVTLVATGCTGELEAVEQASLMSVKLRAVGWISQLFQFRTKLSLKQLIDHKFRIGFGKLIRSVKNCDLVHLIVHSRLEFLAIGLPIVVSARFFSRPIILQLVGKNFQQINKLTAWFLQPFLRMVRQMSASHPATFTLRDRSDLTISPARPLIDLDRIDHRLLERVQPCLLVDGRCGTSHGIRSAISGFRLAKIKYPRCEMVLMLDQNRKSQIKSVFGDSTLDGVEIVTIIDQIELKSYIDRADIYVDLTESSNISNSLAIAAASGRVIVTGQDLPLSRLLANDYGYSPLTFKTGSQLAGKVIDLVEDNPLVAICSERARGLAEAFAWDNVESQWLIAYSSAVATPSVTDCKSSRQASSTFGQSIQF